MLRKALVISITMLSSLSNAEPIDRLAEELITLRSEIEAIHNEIEQNKENFRSQLQSLGLAKSDLVATNQREEMKIKTFQKQKDAATASLAEKFAGDTDLKTFVLSSISELKGQIESSLPFKRSERLKAISELETKLNNNQVSPYKAANRLWGFVEDEFRLQKDIGIYKQIINIDGQEQLCEIAKIGMMTYYFKSPDERYGLLRKTNDQWTVSLLDDSNQIQEVEEIFKLLKKQIRVGVFNLPRFI